MTETLEPTVNAIALPCLRYLAVRSVVERAAIVLASPLILPLCLVIAAAVRLDSSGPILFRQPRPGIGASTFMILKFRTMYANRCDDGHQVALRDDMRITPVGHLLRRTHLDELPQLWNVLRGEMSLIGPRPDPLAVTTMIEAAHPAYRLRRCLRPGVTGWGQVRVGYTDDIEGAKRKLECDLYYIRNVSFRFDLKILLRTLVVLLTARGAR